MQNLNESVGSGLFFLLHITNKKEAQNLRLFNFNINYLAIFTALVSRITVTFT